MATTAVSAKFYETLCLPHFSSIPEVRSAYKTLALKFHPDKNLGNPDAAEKFKEIKEAYEMLSNEDKKKRYDTQLRMSLRAMEGRKKASGVAGTSASFSTSSFSSVFQMHNMFPRQRQRRPAATTSSTTKAESSTAASNSKSTASGGASMSSVRNSSTFSPNETTKSKPTDRSGLGTAASSGGSSAPPKRPPQRADSASRRRNMNGFGGSNGAPPDGASRRPDTSQNFSPFRASSSGSGGKEGGGSSATPSKPQMGTSSNAAFPPDQPNPPPLHRPSKRTPADRLRRVEEAHRAAKEREAEMLRRREEQKAMQRMRDELREEERKRKEEEQRIKLAEREEYLREQQKRAEAILKEWEENKKDYLSHSNRTATRRGQKCSMSSFNEMSSEDNNRFKRRNYSPRGAGSPDYNVEGSSDSWAPNRSLSLSSCGSNRFNSFISNEKASKRFDGIEFPKQGARRHPNDLEASSRRRRNSDARREPLRRGHHVSLSFSGNISFSSLKLAARSGSLDHIDLLQNSRMGDRSPQRESTPARRNLSLCSAVRAQETAGTDKPSSSNEIIQDRNGVGKTVDDEEKKKEAATTLSVLSVHKGLAIPNAISVPKQNCTAVRRSTFDSRNLPSPIDAKSQGKEVVQPSTQREEEMEWGSRGLPVFAAPHLSKESPGGTIVRSTSLKRNSVSSPNNSFMAELETNMGCMKAGASFSDLLKPPSLVDMQRDIFGVPPERFRPAQRGKGGGIAGVDVGSPSPSSLPEKKIKFQDRQQHAWAFSSSRPDTRESSMSPITKVRSTSISESIDELDSSSEIGGRHSGRAGRMQSPISSYMGHSRYSRKNNGSGGNFTFSSSSYRLRPPSYHSSAMSSDVNTENKHQNEKKWTKPKSVNHKEKWKTETDQAEDELSESLEEDIPKQMYETNLEKETVASRSVVRVPQFCKNIPVNPVDPMILLAKTPATKPCKKTLRQEKSNQNSVLEEESYQKPLSSSREDKEKGSASTASSSESSALASKSITEDNGALDRNTKAKLTASEWHARKEVDDSWFKSFRILRVYINEGLGRQATMDFEKYERHKLRNGFSKNYYESKRRQMERAAWKKAKEREHKEVEREGKQEESSSSPSTLPLPETSRPKGSEESNVGGGNPPKNRTLESSPHRRKDRSNSPKSLLARPNSASLRRRIKQHSPSPSPSPIAISSSSVKLAQPLKKFHSAREINGRDAVPLEAVSVGVPSSSALPRAVEKNLTTSHSDPSFSHSSSNAGATPSANNSQVNGFNSNVDGVSGISRSKPKISLKRCTDGESIGNDIGGISNNNTLTSAALSYAALQQSEEEVRYSVIKEESEVFCRYMQSKASERHALYEMEKDNAIRAALLALQSKEEERKASVRDEG